MAQKTMNELGEDAVQADITRLSLAICYAAQTDRLQDAVGMTDTLAQLVHVYTHNSMVAIKEVPITIETARDHANATAAAVYVATCRYHNWLAMDSKDDS